MGVRPIPIWWSTGYIEEIDGRKERHRYAREAFIDIAGEHGVVPSSVDRIYRGAIENLRKALAEDMWM